MAQLSIATRFNSWRELMTAVKVAVAELGTDARPLNRHNRGAIQSSLQVLDTVAATLIDEQQEALALGARQLEEAAALLGARAVSLALADTPIVFASESETARSYRSIARRQERIRRRRMVDQQFRQAIWFDRRVVDALRPAADARRVPVTELVRDLICTIAEDHLVTAVLDAEADAS